MLYHATLLSSIAVEGKLPKALGALGVKNALAYGRFADQTLFF
jgi:hypothetical protein